jgi:hypothetical protein
LSRCPARWSWGKKEVFMRKKLKLIWDKLKIILKDKSGEGNIEKVKNILFTPAFVKRKVYHPANLIVYH